MEPFAHAQAQIEWSGLVCMLHECCDVMSSPHLVALMTMTYDKSQCGLFHAAQSSAARSHGHSGHCRLC